MKSSKYILLAIILLSLNFTGCSFIGAAINSGTNKETEFNKDELDFTLIDSASAVTIVTKNDRLIEGEFVEFSTIPNHLSENGFPSASSIIIRQKFHGGLELDESIPLKNIKQINGTPEGYYNYAGMAAILIGVTIDVILFYEIRDAIRHLPITLGSW